MMMMIMVMVMNAIRGTLEKKCLDEGIETFLSKFAHGIKNEVSSGVHLGHIFLWGGDGILRYPTRGTKLLICIVLIC